MSKDARDFTSENHLYNTIQSENELSRHSMHNLSFLLFRCFTVLKFLDRHFFWLRVESRKAFPRISEVKLSPFLDELDRLGNNTFHLIIIADLYVANKWEIFAKRVSLKSIIGQDTTQVWMIGKEHSIHVPDLAFIPVGSMEQRRA